MSEHDSNADLTSTLPEHWRYVSEGAQTIVFSYIGPHHSHFNQKVLRLRKSPLTNTSAISSQHIDHSAGSSTITQGRTSSQCSFPVTSSPDVADRDLEPNDPTIEFQDRIISRLLRSDNLPSLRSIRVDPMWVQRLQQLSEHHRPVERRRKGGIDTTRRKGVLATDLVGGDGWAVEIKPKWGFLPNPTHLSDATRAKKQRFCRYCMHAALKSSRGEASSQGYCPFDLYSPHEARVKKALEALWTAWIVSEGKSNNLRVFVQGEVVDPHNKESCLSLSKELLGDNSPPASVDEVKTRFVTALLALLRNADLLQKIASFQSALDPLDIEGLDALRRKYLQMEGDNPNSIESLSREPLLDDWERFVIQFSDPLFQGTLDHSNPDVRHLEYYSTAYLLSATFKDCSIILRLGRKGQQDSITAIDLDPKPMNKFEQWRNLDQEIVRTYDGSGKPPCVDPNVL